MKRVLLAMLAVALLIAPGRASADTIELAEVAFHTDGTLVDSLADATPLSNVQPNLNDAGFDYGTGLGTITISITGAGAHTVIGFYDFDIVDLVNNTYLDDSGEAIGTEPAGATWEIDEPDFSFGDIFAHVGNGGPLDGTLFDGTITHDDVSMALAWDVVLAAGETATLSFVTSLIDPGSGFRLRQFDGSDDSVYLSSSMRVTSTPVPEPASLALLGAGALVALSRARRRGRGDTNVAG